MSILVILTLYLSLDEHHVVIEVSDMHALAILWFSSLSLRPSHSDEPRTHLLLFDMTSTGASLREKTMRVCEVSIRMKYQIRRRRKEHEQVIYLVTGEGFYTRKQAINRMRSNTNYPLKASQIEISSRLKNIAESISFLITFILRINWDAHVYDRFLIRLHWRYMQLRGQTYLCNLYDCIQ